MKSEKEIAVEQFVAELLNDSLDIEQVAEFFVDPEKDSVIITGYLKAVRASLKEQSVKFEEVIVLPYHKAKEELEHLHPTDERNVFGVFQNEKLVFPILINDENEIVSCTAISKGSRRGYFLTW